MPNRGRKTAKTVKCFSSNGGSASKHPKRTTGRQERDGKKDSAAATVAAQSPIDSGATTLKVGRQWSEGEGKGGRGTGNDVLPHCGLPVRGYIDPFLCASHCLGLPCAVLPPAPSAAAALIVPLAAAPLPAPVPVLFLSSTLMELKKLSKAAQDLYFNFRVPK